MEQKQDLRVFKTEKAIKEAFLDIRKYTPLEKIKVRDICRKAYINTTTFYNHYTDVLELSDVLENEVLKETFDAIEGKDELFSNPAKFLSEASKRMEEKNEMIRILFQDRKDVQFTKLIYLLRNYYKAKKISAADDIALTFAISGGIQTMYLLLNEGKYTSAQLEKNLAKCIRKVFPEIS